MDGTFLSAAEVTEYSSICRALLPRVREARAQALWAQRTGEYRFWRSLERHLDSRLDAIFPVATTPLS